MKKGTSAIVICFFLILLLPGISKAERFGIKLTGGINYLEVGDPNASLKGFADFLKDFASGGGETIEGDFKKIHFGLDLEGEVVFYLTPRFGISVSSGYIYGNKGVEENKIAFMNQTCSDGMKVSAIPVRLGVCYYLPLSSRIRFFFNGGVGYYFAEWSENYRYEINSNVSTRDQKAKASGIGFHSGVGLELKFVPHIVFIFEGQGRHIKIGGFKGERDSAGLEMNLYYFEQQILGSLDWYPRVDLWPYEPFGAQIRNVREAKVDFSGFTFRAGIKINF